MKTKIFIPIAAFLLVAQGMFATNTSSKGDPEKDRVIVYVLKNILSRYHYVQKKINDDFSEHVYTDFIESLDPSKRYFTQADLKEFSQYKYCLLYTSPSPRDSWASRMPSSAWKKKH